MKDLRRTVAVLESDLVLRRRSARLVVEADEEVAVDLHVPFESQFTPISHERSPG
jgi:hypothetical protein